MPARCKCILKTHWQIRQPSSLLSSSRLQQLWLLSLVFASPSLLNPHQTRTPLPPSAVTASEFTPHSTHFFLRSSFLLLLLTIFALSCLKIQSNETMIRRANKPREPLD